MSFDVYLQHFERGQPAAADRNAMTAVLRSMHATGPGDRDQYTVPIDDLVVDRGPGRERDPFYMEISVSGLDGREEFDGSAALFLHAFSPGVADAIFRIAECAALTIICPAIGPLLPPSVSAADMPDDAYFAERRLVASGAEVHAALLSPFGGYRDLVRRIQARPEPGPGGRLRSYLRRLGI